MTKQHIGSSFDDFLENDGTLAEAQAEAIKRVLAWQIQKYLDDTHTAKTTFAEKLGTSRSQLSRLLDPNNTSLNLRTLSSAAEAMGKHIELRIVNR